MFTPDQIQWVLFFLGLLIGLPISYSLTLSNKLDSIKKEKKDTRNAIKNSIETQEILPVIISIFTTLSSKITFESETNIEEKLESMIYTKENWVRLDSEIRMLEDKISQLAEVDKLFDTYMKCTSYFSKVLFLFVIVLSSIVIVYVFGDFLWWVLWIIAFVQISICLIAIKWKICSVSSKFDKYEDSYIR